MKNLNERDVVGATRLFDAVEYGRMAQVKRLLAAGADPNIPENNGITPLMAAASWGRLRMIRLLVRYGAKLKARDNFGDSAIEYAKGAWSSRSKTEREKQKKVIQLIKTLMRIEPPSVPRRKLKRRTRAS